MVVSLSCAVAISLIGNASLPDAGEQHTDYWHAEEDSAEWEAAFSRLEAEGMILEYETPRL